ncbi:MAG: D-2-hydroxyacid dehydrogenase [Bacteroides sp.]|nr:D-2-hydroxyacid dehydrogenase [Roseburia sp.]MCM1345494.1 D-2-hydroxyacid dehydrogenase [Bacteroides sp.]MCM1420003.1 D-2-hydroxyacid dehydrogenase [Bacteroides sp.]
MKIVILDGFTVNPGDLSWSALESLAEVEVYDRTSEDEIIPRCKGAEMILTNKVVLDAAVLNQLPRLMYIGVLATGYNVVDLEVASRQSIVVTNIPAYSTDSVAQMVFSHLLNIVSRTDHYARENRHGRWSANKDFCYLDHTMSELAGKRMGIVGLGNIGTAVAKIARAFNMEVIAYTSKSEDELPEGVQSVTMDELFTNSDVISLHCPLTVSTRHLVNSPRLHSMKPSAILINTGRGPLVCDEDVADALNHHIIAAYAADVLTEEPPKVDNPLLSARNCYLTPHIAWATYEARQRLINICVENVRAFIKGEPQNQVN